MNWNIAALAIPGFFIFVWLEYLTAKRKKQAVLTFENSISNITIGIAERLMNLFVSGSFYALFFYVYEHFRVFNIPQNFTVWVILLLSTDLVWYWYHRLSHEINIFWAAHIVHHQSEEYNYTVAARITLIQALIRNVFWCALPLVGFHPLMVVTILIIHGTYSFFTHTEVIRNLGWLEYIFITPSHHRVHHASNEVYINKNYGDLFVFWDKIFGTFEKEGEKPRYGLTHPLKSHSFLWQHFHYFMELYVSVRKAKSWRSGWKIIFGKPEMLDQSVRHELEAKFLFQSENSTPTLRFKVYLICQIAFSVICLFLVTLRIQYLDSSLKFFVSFLVLITLINCGALLEQRRWNYYLEYIRLVLIIFYVGYYFEYSEFVFVGLMFSLISLSSEEVKRWYFRTVYNADY